MPYMAANVLLDAWVAICLAHPEDAPNEEQTMTGLLRAAGEANCSQHEQLPFVQGHMHKLAQHGQMFQCQFHSCTAGLSRLSCGSCKATCTNLRCPTTMA